MKRSKTRIIVLLSIVISILFITACSKSDSTEGVVNTPEDNVEEVVYSVTFYDADGSTELSAEQIKDGELVSEYTPEKDNYVFMGWYATPTLSHKFDFNLPITEDTKIFAGFLENKDDTRSFVIVGSGKSPVLVSSSWGKVINEEHILTKEADKNVYSITLDLSEGDEFQFAIDSSWHVQRGAGYLTTTSLDGTDYLLSSSGNYQSGEARKSNIKCLIPGNYTLTLTTYPGADIYDTEDSYYTEESKENFNLNPYDTITWVYNGEAKENLSDMVTTYYIKSSISTEWNDIYEDKYRFKEVDGLPTLTIELEENEEFLFTSTVKVGDTENAGNEYVRYSNIKEEESLKYVEGNDSYNMIAKESGTYIFVYNPDTTELKVAFQ